MACTAEPWGHLPSWLFILSPCLSFCIAPHGSVYKSAHSKAFKNASWMLLKDREKSCMAHSATFVDVTRYLQMCRPQAMHESSTAVLSPPTERVTEPREIPPVYRPKEQPPMLDPTQEPEGPDDSEAQTPLQKQRAAAGLRPGQLAPAVAKVLHREQELLERKMVLKNFWYAAGKQVAKKSSLKLLITKSCCLYLTLHSYKFFAVEQMPSIGFRFCGIQECT